MYSIGAFSKMNRVTVKMLRHYDKTGILKPAHIDEKNGYRYYSSKQFSELHQIMALRQIGFSIAEIKKAINKTSMPQLIHAKKAQILTDIASLTQQLAQVEYYLAQDHAPDIYMKSLPSVIVASMRVKINSHADLFTLFPEMGERMKALGCQVDPIEYCFQTFHDQEFKEKDIDVELCEAVTELKPNQGDLVFKPIPEVPKAACLIHRGPYESIRETHAALHHWLAHNPYTLSGPPREAVIDGIWNKDKDYEWLTEVQFPLTDA
ncbi:MerR family transcriptional regulator [Bacillus sp. JCM 19041]|uniref:MerR family transcriptional regulator n=1 Tax=Bacillus sp. JCM 19041 TaxID=1460637 RepID=UPI000A8D1AB9